jgi:hypothetical protein
MKRFTVALSALLLCGACVGTRSASYTDVSIGALMERPWQFDGQRVRVRGYLVSISTESSIVEAVDGRCYGNGPETRFLTTSLPRSALGEWDGTYLEFDGHLVTVVGVFDNSGRPWRPDPSISGYPDFTAVGPIRRARIEAISEEHCLRIGESSGS